MVAVDDAGHLLPAGEDVPAVHVSVHPLGRGGQRLDDRVPSRPYVNRELGERGGRETVFRRLPIRFEGVGSHLPGLDAERAVGQSDMQPGNRRADILKEDRIQSRAGVSAAAPKHREHRVRGAIVVGEHRNQRSSRARPYRTTTRPGWFKDSQGARRACSAAWDTFY